MLGARLDESLIQETVPRSIRCSVTFSILLAVSLGFAVVLNLPGNSIGDGMLSNLMAVPVTSPARPSKFLAPAFSAQGQFRTAPNVKVRGVPEQANEPESAFQATPQSRRAALLSSGALLSSFAGNQAHASVTACKPGANNCWSTTSTDKTKMTPWTWPSGTSREKAISELKAVLDGYPQAGQEGVDLGGWSVAVDDLADKGYMRLEYKSGIGTFAKFFNGGKPFVDDLEVSVEPSFVAVRSSSRVGDSDFGVNAKRINYLASVLRGKGWDAPEIPA
eukprot:gnl/MRDRNA2_/MRDRNA2_173321_c0_seq1.p1 gnl/MRDRNA2_/MRDRNA2_173321_c0~~gnl/MRDRNA2_/MRDRNA2_173321_c0_seq1.p1  ORF type:complete len:277 (+),score=61.33 gnl/MRDRNA2_/MRDRNA2_173321_c0_seq1:76-906(+)